MGKFKCELCGFSCRKKYYFSNHKCINENIKNKEIVFNNIISLGYNCTIANALIDVRYRDLSYPFDWNFTLFDKVIECFQNNFVNFFNIENLVKSRYYANPAEEVKNNKRLITYVHDGSFDNLKRDKNFYEKVKEKYNKRIKRLIDLLYSEKNILFVRLDYGDLSKVLIEKFVKVISERYKCNFNLLILTKNKNLKSKKINEKIIIVDDINLNRWNIGDYLKKNINATYYQPLKKTYNN